MSEIDTETALVVDDKPRLELKVGDHFRAAVLPSREGGKFEIKFRDIKMTIYGLGEYAFVDVPEGRGIVFMNRTACSWCSRPMSRFNWA